MLKELKPAVLMLIVMTALTGALYPMIVTGIAQVAFARQANGSLVERDGKKLGSELIGQPFGDPKRFWSRPSGTSPYPYNASSSSGSNQGPLNPELTDTVAGRIKALRDADPDNAAPVPVDLVTASASGLDPHISPDSAMAQVTRVAGARHITSTQVQQFVTEFTEGRDLGILGEPRVNVLALNLALDEKFPGSH